MSSSRSLRSMLYIGVLSECARVCAHGGLALSSQGRFVSTDVGHKQLVAKAAKLAGSGTLKAAVASAFFLMSELAPRS